MIFSNFCKVHVKCAHFRKDAEILINEVIKNGKIYMTIF